MVDSCNRKCELKDNFSTRPPGPMLILEMVSSKLWSYPMKMRATLFSSIVAFTLAQAVQANDVPERTVEPQFPSNWKSSCGAEELRQAKVELSSWLTDLTKNIQTQPEYAETCSLIQNACVNVPIVYFFAVTRTGELQAETLVQTSGPKADSVRKLLLKATPFRAPSNNLPLACQRGVEVKFFNSGSHVNVVSDLGSRLRNAHIGDQNQQPIVHFF